MNKYIESLLNEFSKYAKTLEQTNYSLEEIINNIENQIIVYTKEYMEKPSITLKNRITSLYNLLYYFKLKASNKGEMYHLSERLQALPNIYTIEETPEKFDINYELLKNININEGLTLEEAYELLRWTSNNTRYNISFKREDVYGNESLINACGFAQFSSLYPLQQLGLKVTINNISAIERTTRHGYGTVTIPIKTESGIEERRFIIDCTYRQFFTIPYNCIARYIGFHPNIGFIIEQNEEQKKFAIQLLKDGFIEATDINLEHYLKPFFASAFSLVDFSKVNEEFSKIDITDLLENHQEEFDFDKEDFDRWGYNLEIGKIEKTFK